MPRKICFVEAQRKEATQAFLGRIKGAGLRLPNGQRDWVAVYDWRALQAITDEEGGNKSLFAGFSDPWRKFFVGLA